MSNSTSKKVIFSALSLVLLLALAEGVCSLVDWEYHYYKNDIEITDEYRHFYEREGKVHLKQIHQGTLKTDPFDIVKKTKRVMIFGGSSVYNLKFVYLNNFFKEKNIEFINIGGNSYGTTRIALLLKELINYSPDLVILYTGHNEFEEKFVNEKLQQFPLKKSIIVEKSALAKAIKFGLDWLLSTAGQAVVESNNQGLPVTRKVEWGVRYNKNSIYINYRLNLKMILDRLLSKNIPVILNTVAYNRDHPPFVEKDKGTYHKCLMINDLKERVECQEVVLNQDLEPHRASVQSNKIIRSLAEELGLLLNDIDHAVKEAVLKKDTDFNQYFLDHCHLTP